MLRIHPLNPAATCMATPATNAQTRNVLFSLADERRLGSAAIYGVYLLNPRPNMHPTTYTPQHRASVDTCMYPTIMQVKKMDSLADERAPGSAAMYAVRPPTLI